VASPTPPTHLGSISELTTGRLELTLSNLAGDPVTALTSATVTIRDLTSGDAIDDAINAMTEGAIDGNGLFTFPLTSARTAAIGTPTLQRRLVTFDFVFSGGRKTHELTYDVVNLRDISS
jgi:hypothetical protein